jgi:hypothetical protein
LLSWSDLVSGHDGSWVNDPTGNAWKGITVFGAAALGEALRHHGDLLDDAARTRWENRLRRAADFLHGFITMDTGPINYPITAASTLAIAGQVLGEERYTIRARELAHQSLAFFTQPNNLLWGEGARGPDDASPRGLRPVDLGYNVEESLPALAMYARLTGDEKVLAVAVESLRSHLEFLLPDGAWDNSWGTRNFKWTYWGSRTSDGCQSGLMLLAAHDARFGEAARRNLQLLAACTHDGLLTGGPHFHGRGEPPCLHHTFCHARALAATLDEADFDDEIESETKSDNAPRIALPRDEPRGIKEFPEIATWLVGVGPWRATVTAYDFIYSNVRGGHASGGALSMLWHEQAGPILCASMADYTIVEGANQQTALGPNDGIPLTPRLELSEDGRLFRSDLDHAARVASRSQTDLAEFEIAGHLVDLNQSAPPSEPRAFAMSYRFTPGEVSVSISADAANGLVYRLPIVSPHREEVRRVDERTVEISRPNATVRVAATVAIEVGNETRIFNHTPGFEALELCLNFADGEAAEEQKIEVQISVF